MAIIQAGPTSRPDRASPRAERLWYVRAMHLQTGATIERISAAGAATTPAEAAEDMRHYLLRGGRVTDADIDSWCVEEASRWPMANGLSAVSLTLIRSVRRS